MDGIINVLKPPGLTSRQVVSVVKGITGEKKIGHGGTLDPGACGVLPVLIGRGTKLFEFGGENKKEYIGEFVFGKSTTTQDAYGQVVRQTEKTVSKADVEKVIPQFTGEICQRPSLYSAVHINGKRAYEYARSGKTAEMPQRTVTVYETELIRQTADNAFLMRVLCSKGCYIRSLCEDMAAALGTVGYLSLLIRTKSGGCLIENSYTIDELENTDWRKLVTPITEILAQVPSLQVPEKWDKALKNGNKIPVNLFERVEEETVYRLFDSHGVLWALGQKDGDIIRMKQMLRETNETV